VTLFYSALSYLRFRNAIYNRYQGDVVRKMLRNLKKIHCFSAAEDWKGVKIDYDCSLTGLQGKQPRWGATITMRYVVYQICVHKIVRMHFSNKSTPLDIPGEKMNAFRIT
jgi:hypothetical protein